MSRGEESPERKSSTSAKESKKSSSSSSARAAAARRRPSHPSARGGVALVLRQCRLRLQREQHRHRRGRRGRRHARRHKPSGGMENGNVIIKSGSVTAANGTVERSAGASPVNHLDGGKEDGSVMFGLLRAPRL